MDSEIQITPSEPSDSDAGASPFAPNNLVSLFLEQKWTTVHPLLKEWVPRDLLRQRLAGLLDADLAAIDDSGRAADFRKWCPVDGTVMEDYRHRILKLEGGGHLLVGIRFRGLDMARPFVELAASDFSLDTPELLRDVIDAVRESFSLFSPLWVRVPGGSVPAEVGARVSAITTDEFFVGGVIERLQQREPPHNYDQVVLESCTDTECHVPMMAAYHEFQTDNPKLAAKVHPATVGELEQCLSDGHVCVARIGGCDFVDVNV